MMPGPPATGIEDTMEAIVYWHCTNPACGKPFYDKKAPGVDKKNNIPKCNKCGWLVKAGPKPEVKEEPKIDAKANVWQQYRAIGNHQLLKVATVDEAIGWADGKAGLPDKDSLASLCNVANGLKIKTIKGKYDETLKGIYFSICLCNKGSKGKSLFDGPVTHKDHTDFCFENTILPLDIPKGSALAIHQGLAPCELCRDGFSHWANTTGSTIVVAFDDGYDQIKGGAIFIFSSAGNVFLLARKG
jgi:hypothetical protein